MENLYIFIGSYLGEKAYHRLRNLYFKKNISVSNSEYERVLFNEFSKTENCLFISAPSVGRYPVSCKRAYYKKSICEGKITDCSFLTIIGVNNFSKSCALKLALKKQISKYKDKKIFVIACEAHKPYLSALKVAKRNGCSTMLIVPDSPASMSFSNSFLYKFLKKYDVRSIKKMSEKYSDCFLYFTDEIRKDFSNEKQYIIREGILSDITLMEDSKKKNKCVYIGKTDIRNGINYIIQSAMRLPDFSFDIYGSGDYDEVLKTINIRNIKFYGFINPNAIDSILKKADILLSPRTNDVSYTGLSFPSKILKYLSYSKPVVTFKLPCYNQNFDSVLVYPSEESIDSFVSAIKKASGISNMDCYVNIVNKLSYLKANKIVEDIKKLFDRQ